MELEELKIRQLTNQHLLEPTDSLSVVQDLCGIQSQFLSNALHAIRIRSRDFEDSSSDDLIKTWAIRGTMHLIAREDLPVMLHTGRTHFLRPCDTLEEDEFITRERKQFFADLIVDSIFSGIDTREGLKEICVSRGMTDTEAESVFNPWGGTIRALCESGKICHQVQEKKAFRLCPPFTPMDGEAAQLELARRYFTHYGPATVKDAAYFFACPQTQVKKWLGKLPVTDYVCGGRNYFAIEQAKEYPNLIPDCLFLAGFDPLLLGYQKTESLYLPQEHLRKIFTLAGIVMPAVLLHGRVVGQWKRKNTKLLITLFEPLSSAEKEVMEQKIFSLERMNPFQTEGVKKGELH